MGCSNDPFYIGSAAHYVAAEWARRLYMLLPAGQKVHIRRLHYFALTQPQHTKPSGQVYRNTGADWKFLCDACKFARYLEILPYDVFIDRRRAAAVPLYGEPAGFDCPQQWTRTLTERIEALCRMQMKLMLARLMPVHIEVWVEKSSAADLIESVGHRYSVNIMTTAGELSLTAVWDFIKRIKDARKPVRIFYISDFDPAGENMPISVSRKIEFLLRRYRLSKKVDLKLRPLLLTRLQCRRFNLPGVPLPEGSRWNSQFARYNGRVATELHALEVARPGHIRQMVQEELGKYLNLVRLSRACRLAEAALQEVLEVVRVLLAEQQLLPVALRLLERSVAGSWRRVEYDGPWLLDSERDYLTQLATYHLYRLR